MINKYKNVVLKLEWINLIVLIFLYISFMIVHMQDIYITSILNVELGNYLQILCMIYFIIIFTIKFLTKPKNLNFSFKLELQHFLLLIWGLFSFTILLSKLYNYESGFSFIGYFFFIPVIYFIAIPGSLDQPINTIIKAAIYSSLFYLIISGMNNPYLFGNGFYYGVFRNPNTVGLVALQLAISSISIFISKMNHNFKKIEMVFYFILFLVALIFIFASQSRTALFSLVICVLSIVLINVYYGKIKLSHLFLIGLIFIVVYVLFLSDFFERGIQNKIILSSNTDLLSGRGYIWEEIIDNAMIFGHGENYFSSESILGIGSHNSILMFLGYYGTINAFLLTLFLIFSLSLALRFFKNNLKNSECFIPLVFILTYLALNMAESYFGLVSITFTIIYYNLLGVLIFEKT